jgi:hypothetical protein
MMPHGAFSGRLLVALCLVSGTSAHGFMTLPSSRQPGAPGLNLNFTDHANAWYTKTGPLLVNATICDRALLTMAMAADGVGIVCGKSDGTKTHPWRAPGAVAIQSPCGNKVTRGPGGETLPPTARSVWQAGTAVEVAMAATNNHGGGYSYRLCPSDSKTTEACFQKHHLNFADNIHTVRFANGSSLQIPARRTTSTPGNRMWKEKEKLAAWR